MSDQEFLPTISIQYHAEKWWEYESINYGITTWSNTKLSKLM